MPIPTDPIDKFTYFADRFVGSLDGLQTYCNDSLMEARDELAVEKDGNASPEQRAALCLRQVEKKVQSLMFNVDSMYESLKMSRPFGTK